MKKIYSYLFICLPELKRDSDFKKLAVLWASHYRTTSVRSLLLDEFDQLYRALLNMSVYKMIARFDPTKPQHALILRLCHQLGWEQADFHVDLERLGRFIMSPKSPVRKPLLDMTRGECSRFISCLQSIYKKTNS